MGSRVKRAFDVLGAGAGLCLTAPIFATISVAIAGTMGRPIFFRQPRAGLKGTPFAMYKFRTMRDALDERGRQRPDHERITKLGNWLRATSLDELPELWNVLRGDMSLVGPRPLLVHYLPRYTPTQAKRHDVRPGITGWAQINGRNAISWDEKFALDLWYIAHWSIALDLRILWRTVKAVVLRDGINSSAQATMPEFMGTDDPQAKN